MNRTIANASPNVSIKSRTCSFPIDKRIVLGLIL